MVDSDRLNLFANDRLGSRQIDELIGISRGLCADGELNQLETEFLLGWLANNQSIVDNPVISTLYNRVAEFLSDGVLDDSERSDLFGVLREFSAGSMELGEALKATTLPLCDPPPHVEIYDHFFCFTGTFNFGTRSICAKAVEDRGGYNGSLTKKTDYLVIGAYATESWKHSTFGNKILKAVEMRGDGVPISILSEEHWRQFV